MQDNTNNQPHGGGRRLPSIIAICAIFVAVISLYVQKQQDFKLERLQEENRKLSEEILYLKGLTDESGRGN